MLGKDFGRMPHEVAMQQLDVPGEPIPTWCITFAIRCQQAWGRQMRAAEKQAEAEAEARARNR